ncbi:MAG: GNAT family N-acetyltransferase [Pyrinomonadaceae bacterium]|nr:GNAT family N-acetyltransferase [Pyrinomonadaceae bacterium]
MKNQFLKIQGEKVFLRYVKYGDFEEMLELFKTSLEIYEGLINPPLDLESFKVYVDRNLEDANECFLICQNIGNKIVGAINLTQIFRKSFQNCYLGYSLGVNFIGKGYMTEAVNLVLHHAFENLKLHRVEANVQPHNLASIKVLQRCGFTKEGFSRKYLKIDNVWCDHERWAIIFEDWKK